MAKKNSSKTATEKAIQSSEPRVINYRGWQGVNFADAPLTWEPLEAGPRKFRQTDLPANFLMVQNNLNTSDMLGLETRPDSIVIGQSATISGYVYKFTGVATVYRHWLFCVARTTYGGAWYEVILYRSLLDDDVTDWTVIRPRVGSTNMPPGYEIREIGFFEGQLVATAWDHNSSTGLLFLAKATIDDENNTISIVAKNYQDSTTLTNMISDTPYIDNPTIDLSLTAVGMAQDDHETEEAPVRISVCMCYTNRLGSTLVNESHMATTFVEFSPTLWTNKRYLQVKPASIDTNIIPGSSIEGIDIYARELENIDWVFVGHINVKPVAGGVDWTYSWYGNMTDTSQWVTSQLLIPSENTTHGPQASHFSHHDSRMYYWGVPDKPYRLYIGGNPGAEFSIARGLGGAWVDIEPGSGYDVMGTAKWKTTSGANIITIMCGNRNTNKVKRFNLVETNLTLTNEVAYKSYMYEEVSNVIGCNSRWGYGVYSDGLYSLSRYGLMLTTMAMEYNAQMKEQSVSDQIKPIFSERLGTRLRDGRMVCIDDIIYIALSEGDTAPASSNPPSLDNVILCYDVDKKAWYTWTHDQTLIDSYDDGSDDDHVLHIFPVDSDEYIEGLGAITETEVRLYPTTGVQELDVPDFQILMETGELIPRLPEQAFWYVQQFEFRFDYMVADPEDPAEILIEGTDYYGRDFSITKKINFSNRNWPNQMNDNSIVRKRQVHNRLLDGNGNVVEEWDSTEPKEIVERRNYIEWVRVDKLVESLRIRIKGRVRFRLTHINCKCYQQADTIGTPYGFDAGDSYRNRHGGDTKIHHYINDYNNLRRAVVT